MFHAPELQSKHQKGCHKSGTHYSLLAMLNVDFILMGLQRDLRHGKAALTFTQAYGGTGRGEEFVRLTS